MRETLAMQYGDYEQQAESVNLGVWVFLATEVLFFGGLFLSYTIYRVIYPEAFAEAGRRLDVTIGSVNTALLLTSSFFMALAVQAAREGRRKGILLNLALTEILGLGFLVLKAKEYSDDVAQSLVPGMSVAIQGPHAPQARLFYFIYYVMTGLHAVHLTIGLVLIGVLIARARKNEFTPVYHSPVEGVGLYWHFVDAVWIFLYPLLYLMDRHA